MSTVIPLCTYCLCLQLNIDVFHFLLPLSLILFYFVLFFRGVLIFEFQAKRAEGCREECALCADRDSPCQNCYQGFPSATMCEDPETRVFWDIRHFTTAFHRILAEAVRQCSKDCPNYDHPWVELLCPRGVIADGSDASMR